MVERRQHLRFTSETRETFGVEREGLGQDFQRDVAIELRVARAIHLAHAARAERGHDFVRADPAA